MSHYQDKIQSLLDRLTGEGTQRGLQVAVYLEGEQVVDAWSGVMDPRGTLPVQGDTLFPVFSVSKGMAATLAHQAVERGLLSYDLPIAEVWPEFAAHGKEKITLRHALNHTAGLPNMPSGVGYAELGNWDAMCSAVAAMSPVTPPGVWGAYHAITFGWIVGETVRRVDGRSFQQHLHEAIALPLGIADDMFIGIPDEVEPRVALLEEYDLPPLPDPVKPSPVPGWVGPLYAFMNRVDVRRACLPASSGIMTARAVARHYAALLPGGIDGVELLSPARVREATAPQDTKSPTGEPFPWALGYAAFPAFAAPNSGAIPFGHGGYGGSMGFADPGRKMAVAINRNWFNKQNVVELVLQELK